MIGARRCVILCIIFAASFVTAEIQNKGWWKNTVFYQIYPRSFMDSDGNGVGDLNGVTQKLEHFVESGVGAIWLSPICVSPMVDFGYDISDFKDIDPAFGTLADFVNLVKRAHELGLKVILDFVPNHTSDKHYWFQQSVEKKGKYSDYYIWKDGYNSAAPPNNWISLFDGSAWAYHEGRKQWYLHQFVKEQPDLNYTNPEVRKEMEDVILFWLDKGVDGFRIDAVPHIFEDASFPNEPVNESGSKNASVYDHLNHIYTKDYPQTYELIQSWRNLVDDYADKHNQSEKVILTEAYTSLENTTKFYNFGSHVPFNFKFITDVSATSNAADFKRVIDDWMQKKPENGVANWVMGNHDNKRTPTRYPGRGDQMTMLAMVLPGVAVTYYGEEIGMVDKSDITYDETQDPQGKLAGPDRFQSVSRDPCRTPFQWDSSTSAGFSSNSVTWLPVHSNYKELNLEAEKKNSESSYSMYKYLTALRKSSDVLKEGSLQTVIPGNNNNVLAVIRSHGQKHYILVLNLSGKDQQTVDLSQQIPATATIDFGGNKGKSITTKDITLPANSSLLLSATTSGASGIARDIFGSSSFKIMFALTLSVMLLQSQESVLQ